MVKKLRVLIVEDSENDALLMARALRDGGREVLWRRVDSAPMLEEALGEATWDIVLTDYSLPGFGGLEAVKTVRALDNDLPIIVVSGSSGEREAVEMLKAGAQDYFTKDRMGLLPPAVARELKEAEKRRSLRRAREKLISQEQRYRLLFETSPLGIYEVTVHGKILNCNPAMAKMLGWESPEALMSNGNAFSLYEDHSERERFLDILNREGRVVNREVTLKRTDGEEITTLESAVLLFARAGEKEVISGIALNITEKKKNEAELLLLATVVEQTQEGIILTDIEGNILYANAAMTELTGYATEELVGENPRLLKSGKHDDAFYEELWRTITEGNTWKNRIINKRKDGSTYTADMVIMPVRDPSGRITAFVGSQRDVTEQIKLMEQLKRARDLETIGMIAGGMAHEVRNPLFAITTLVASVEKNFADVKGLNEYLDMIREQAEGLSAMMEDVLALGRPITVEEFEPCSLQEAASDALTMLEQTQPESENSVVVEAPSGPLIVNGQLGKLSEVIMNIVGNALHFSPPETKVAVSLRREGDSAVVEISDEGPGIPQDLMPDLFRPFRSRRKGGTGLGLAIVRKIVEAHGGTVTGANRDPGPGAVFTVTLPIANDPPADGGGSNVEL